MEGMITIPPIHMSNVATAKRAKRKDDAEESGFSGYMSEAEAVDSPAPVAATASLAATNPLLSLQEVAGPSVADAKAIKHGHQSLDLLEDIRLSLMCGGIPLEMMHKIDMLVAAHRREPLSPNLADIVDEIEVRVAVERAKIEMALHQRTD